jgi:hypothetical protein
MTLAVSVGIKNGNKKERIERINGRAAAQYQRQCYYIFLLFCSPFIVQGRAENYKAKLIRK